MTTRDHEADDTDTLIERFDQVRAHTEQLAALDAMQRTGQLTAYESQSM